MSLRSFFTNSVAGYRADQRGGVAITFAIASIAIIGAAGAALDFSNSARVHDRVQNIADLASLAAAQSQSDDDGELATIADAVFVEHFGTDSDVEITNVAKVGDTVTVAAATTVPTTLLRVLGKDTVDVSVKSSAVFTVDALDMALVLDTTSSMRGEKLASLKRAAGELIDVVDQVGDDNVRLSVVPFTNHVNVGLDRRDADWLDVPPDTTETQFVRVEGSARNCRQESGTYDDDGRTVPWEGEVCDYDYEELEVDVTWQGCVGSRFEPQDERAAFAGNPIPGILGDKCGREIQGLSSDMSVVGASVDALEVQGRRTYMPAGLLWGWRLLDGDAPFPNPDADRAGDRVMVLMSDGDNTTSKTGDSHEGDRSTKALADAKTARLCQQAKDGGTTIYTIAFQIDDAATRNLLRDCATDPSRAFDARDETQLTEAFQTIAESVMSLRVAS